MTNLFTELIKFFSEFTWKKFFSVIVMLAVFFIIVSIYEIYTSAFRFSRLQKAADLLAEIQTIDSHGTNSTPELERAKKALISQAVEAIDTKPMTLDFVPSTLKFSMDGLEKFFAGGLIWYIFALTQIRKIGKPNNPFVGMILIAVISGFTAMFVRSIWWPWFHILIYPWIFLFGIGMLLLPIGYFFSKRAAKQKLKEQAQQNEPKGEPS
jgi:hypothetical protein